MRGHEDLLELIELVRAEGGSVPALLALAVLVRAEAFVRRHLLLQLLGPDAAGVGVEKR